MIEESIIDISRDHRFPNVAEALQQMRPSDGDSLNKLRAKFFLLLCENEAMRKRMCEPRDSSMFIAPLCHEKARLFYDELCDELVPRFLQNETVTLDVFVDWLREAYLHS